MFEKSLYDLIRGLRNHRGSEVEYIQNSLKECKSEIKSPDMDRKTIALLKLIYLEMFGYDMSWASFHVLEVMSSTKYLQKRVGYLAAEQSFRSDTEVLMLATNLLKKDIVSSSVPNLSLPLATLPHIITPSLAMSLLADLLPRISHSNTAVRKKAVVVLYRLALVYPEALRLAWPKIKERLMDRDEDSSITAAVVNVVCELGWRRPHDFLPLAPRFFELLVDGGNNWMAIKIIKLFATLTPLEPRLVRKLLRPLTDIIQTTTAMSLLYECINGIIQGGILGEADGSQEGDEIAGLCVAKLRGMVVMDADPNLKYVALLAFNRIVPSHPALVAEQQSVIMDCLDDLDISIRLQALELAVQMVTSETLQQVVDRLIKQLQQHPSQASSIAMEDLTISSSDNGAVTEQHKHSSQKGHSLPQDYRDEVLRRILDICSRDNYSDILDFEWYLNILAQLMRLLPSSHAGASVSPHSHQSIQIVQEKEIASRIGAELRNVAVRVKAVRKRATEVAESFLFHLDHAPAPLTASSGIAGVLGPVTWVLGEYAEYLEFPERTLTTLIAANNVSLPGSCLSLYLQAIPKIFLHITSRHHEWNTARHTDYSHLLTRIISFLEALATHPDLDVQERTVEFLELLRLAKEAMSPQSYESRQLPFLVTSVVPSLFAGLDLNPVAINAQRRVPLPEKLDLDQSINDKIQVVFEEINGSWLEVEHDRSTHDFYHLQHDPTNDQHEGQLKADQQTNSYQETFGAPPQEPGVGSKRRFDRKDRNKDDPFYIGHDEDSSGRSTPFHQVFTTSNGKELDIDSIPIINLAIDIGQGSNSGDVEGSLSAKRQLLQRENVEITGDETFAGDETIIKDDTGRKVQDINKVKRNFLEVDSSRLRDLSLDEHEELGSKASHTLSRTDDAEMIKAMQEVERLRLEMQRASERISVQGMPTDGALVKKKGQKKKKKKPRTAEIPAGDTEPSR